ncbi:MAG TPA: BadF/BadG/BcrA/BcrD ATPase family protein [Vicinamibacterales bacterium]|nr:BadF/BadG/BcrA/BcrD ATPase family protein [Vicinamibacterales bacterium]
MPSSRARLTGSHLVLGVDVGSTTVKAIVVDPLTRDILWSDYQRHETRQAEKVMELLVAIGDEFSDIALEHIRIFITGSGAGPLRAPLGAKFVQEVNAVTMAVDALHPDAGSVIELGGQDAKIIIYKETATGGKRAIASMNDKCASGTGATIDKCLIKVGMPRDQLQHLQWDASRLHHVAAKCGVFAETDIVNLVKSGIPAPEIMCSLADAIVGQNLSVLTRGNTLRPKVLLLGGPNAFLPFLQACWRQRIPETWASRGFHVAGDAAIESLIVVPEQAEYYAAYGAVMYGLHEADGVAQYRGLDPLKAFIGGDRKAQLGEAAGPPLVSGRDELEAFRRTYSIPRFEPASFVPGQLVRGVIGLDGGSTSSKAVLVGEDGQILVKQYQLSQGNPIADTKQLLAKIKEAVHRQGATLEVLGFGATGYAADVLEESLRADVNIVETVAHMIAAVKYFGDVDVICDIGGQDIKVLFMAQGEIRNFRLSNQCSAGNGMLLQAMADQFGVPVTDYADTAFRAGLTPKFSYGCAVFLDADRVNFQKEGYSKEELLAGLAMVLPKNVWQYVVQIPRMAALGRKYVLQGGTQYNLAGVKAQVDYIKARVPDAEVHVHPHPGEAGAIGAALETLRVVTRRGRSTFVGLDAAIDLAYTSRNDETTRCHFCPNDCARTFIDARTPDGATSRYISGFSCEKGTVESAEALKTLTARRRDLRLRYPNLVDYESKVLFRSFYAPEPLPEAGALIDSVDVRKTVFGGVKKTPVRRPFQRSAESAQSRRRHLHIGIPRVLNIYSTAPIWRTYFETLGLKSENLVFSDYTSEELWAEGGKYGSIDPCYPSKVCQAHIHNLLFRQPRHKFDYIFFPCITHVPTFVVNTMDDTSCPIVAGAPKVVRAAFTKEVDFFAERGIEYVDSAVTLVEPNYFARQMFGMWGERLGLTEDENDWACRQGFAALRALDEDLQSRGLEILQSLEEENKVGVLMLGRPYHLDPGLNHDVLDEFQALGYPILSMRSVPKDPTWLARFFKDDLDRGFVTSPLDVSDVWPENYSANSVQKVWAAKFAARHPNVVVLDLSSFKCGHDAPTYGLIDNIISSSRTPYSALHDIDANKPAGSIKLRVKTYAHTLARHEERLHDLAAARSELQQRVEAKRHALMRERQVALAEASSHDQAVRQRRDEMNGAYRAYLQEDPVLPAFSEARRLMDVAPEAPIAADAASAGAAVSSTILWMKEIQP